MTIQYRLTGLCTLAIALALGACQPREPAPTDDSDRPINQRDTMLTPLGADDDVGAGAEATATLGPVGQRDARGMVNLSRTEQGARVAAEIGGFDDQTHYIDLLDLHTCDEIGEAEAGAPLARLGEIDVLDDGTGRLETEVRGLTLDGPQGALGRIVAVRHPDGSAAACGVVGPAVR